MDALTALATRRSTRKYKAEQIKDSELEIIMQAAQASPCGKNAYSDLHISVIQNPEILKNLSEFCGKEMGTPQFSPFYNSPTLIIMSAKPKADGQLVYVADVGCVMENMQIAATEIGLGCVYLWAMLNRIPQDPKFVETLNLPEGFKAISALALGYPETPLVERSLADLKQSRIQTQIIK